MSSVIHGTHRLQDLLPAFMKEIEARTGVPVTEPILPEEDDHLWWESEEADWVLEEFFDRLSDLAPPGTQFGAHEGDGSDFGFWEVTL